MRLQRIDVIDAQEPSGTPLASFEDKQLDALQPVGVRASDVSELSAGATVIAFMWLPIDGHARIPVRLRHRVVTTTSMIEGAVVSTRHNNLQLFAPPVRGAGWLASDGPSNDPSNHHRRGILAINGQVTISRRYAIDWMIGAGQYAWYFHLAPGSLQVKTGERVRRGQLLARIGYSGDPPVPHLHFEVTTSSKLLAGEGLPYVIDHYRIWNKDKVRENRTGEFPLDGMVVDFGQGALENGKKGGASSG